MMGHPPEPSGPTSSGRRERQPLTPPLAAAIESLRVEAEQDVTRPSEDGRLEASVRRVIRQARMDGLRAEELVVAFREVWNRLPPPPPAVGLQEPVLVSALIHAFYEDQAD